VGFALLLQGLAGRLLCPPASKSPVHRRAMLAGLLYAIPLWVLAGRVRIKIVTASMRIGRPPSR
jgi:hypothetical protein